MTVMMIVHFWISKPNFSCYLVLCRCALVCNLTSAHLQRWSLAAKRLLEWSFQKLQWFPWISYLSHPINEYINYGKVHRSQSYRSPSINMWLIFPNIKWPSFVNQHVTDDPKYHVAIIYYLPHQSSPIHLSPLFRSMLSIQCHNRNKLPCPFTDLNSNLNHRFKSLTQSEA